MGFNPLDLFNPTNIFKGAEKLPFVGSQIDMINNLLGIDTSEGQDAAIRSLADASQTYGNLRDPYQKALMNGLQQRLAVTKGQNQLLGEMGGHPIDYGALLKNPWTNTGLKR